MDEVLARNHVQVRGAGPPVVLAPGLGCDQTVFAPLVERLSPRHRVVLFDYVGTGRSDRTAYDPERYAGFEGHVDDLREVCDALGLDRPALVGHSMSAMVGLRLAAADPRRFSRLVLLGASPRYLDDPPYRGGFTRKDVDALLEVMEQNFRGWAASFAEVAARDAALAPRLCAGLVEDPRHIRRLVESIFLSDHRPLLSSVSAPCLVLQSTRDDVVPVSVGEYLAAALPRARLSLLDVPGHLPHVSHPEVTAAAVAAFLEADPLPC